MGQEQNKRQTGKAKKTGSTDMALRLNKLRYYSEKLAHTPVGVGAIVSLIII